MRIRIYLIAGLAVIALAGAGLNLTTLAPPAATAVGELRLVVNVPAYRLDVYENGQFTRSYDVAIGAPKHATPVGKHKLLRAVWNPWWHPPNSRWARGEKPTPPGPDNPMGRVKLYFGNLYYIHGTPHDRSMGWPASHGCIRMTNQDIVELARLVHRYATPHVASAELDRLEASPTASKTLWFKKKVELDVRYDLVEVRNGELAIYSDVYRRGGGSTEKKVRTALARAGIGEDQIDPANLENVLALAQRNGLVVPLDRVLATYPQPASSAAAR